MDEFEEEHHTKGIHSKHLSLHDEINESIKKDKLRHESMMKKHEHRLPLNEDNDENDS